MVVILFLAASSATVLCMLQPTISYVYPYNNCLCVYNTLRADERFFLM
jgi:hypothetical protein